MKYVNLHSHTTLSIFDALGYPADYINFILENAGEDSMAYSLTDHGTAGAYGYLYQQQKKLKDKGIPFKCIYGVETYYIPSFEDWKIVKENLQNKKKKKEKDEVVIENEDESKSKLLDPINRRHHLVLLAYNQEGLKNLYRLISSSYIEGFYRFPRIDFNLLEKYNKGLILSTACIQGFPSYLVQKIKNNEPGISDQNIIKIAQNQFSKHLEPILNMFEGRSYLELQFNALEEQKLVNLALIEYAKNNGHQLIVTSDAHYPTPDHWKHREIYKALGWQRKGEKINVEVLDKKIDDLKCLLYPHNGDQIYGAYKKYQPELPEEIVREAIERTYVIAHEYIEQIDPGSKPKLPKIEGSFERLKRLTIEGLKRRGLDKNKKYVDRAIFELKVIREKDFSQYFIVLHEAIRELRKELFLGPARGSAAGSLVCYLIDITQLDPIKHGLLFERFLSISRADFPDVDIDVSNRDIAIEILIDYFGKSKVSYVSNYSTLQLKSLVKDISKLHDINFQEVNEVTKIMEVEARRKILDEIGGDQKLYQFTFEGARKHSPTFRQYLNKYPEVAEYIEKLYGQVRATSCHAGGTILCENIIEDMPVIKSKGKIQTPWTEGLNARHLEQMGLVKYDFLGVATLRMMERCVELIAGEYNIKEFYDKHLHPDVINTNDQNVYENVFWNRKFVNIFQFTEIPVQKFINQIVPTKIDDISACTSTFRPGPLSGNADKKLLENRGKHINYEHPILEKILGPTNNCLIYQEQFMQLANKLAGFELDEADKLRKILMKPSHELGEELKKKRLEAREKFVSGCIKKGIEYDRAVSLWDEDIVGFISYGFNKSHSISYSYISFQCAWLMTYYEKEWIQACLEVDEDRDKIIQDISYIGYKFQKPDIIKSVDTWKVDGKKIYPAISSIKGIGKIAARELMKTREHQGQFNDLFDFFYDEDGNWRWSKFNKKCLERFIMVEGLDSLGCVGHGKMFDNYRHMFEVISNNFDPIKKMKLDLREAAAECDDKRDYTKQQKINIQRDVLGYYDKGLLFDQKLLDILLEYDVLPLADLSDGTHLHWFIVKEIKRKLTRNNNLYLNMKISDIDDRIRYLNYFGGGQEDIKENCVYVAPLFVNNRGFISVQWGRELIEASQIV